MDVPDAPCRAVAAGDALKALEPVFDGVHLQPERVATERDGERVGEVVAARELQLGGVHERRAVQPEPLASQVGVGGLLEREA